MMIKGAMLVWFVLTGLSVVFVSMDIRHTPAHPVIKWAFLILTLFTGPFAAFFYVIGCREPLHGTHEAYVAFRWRQVLGSTMHCAAGDGIGIITGAAVSAHWHLTGWLDFALEYLLGFGFGWAVFQAFAMRDMAGGDYMRSLRQTFLPEFLSMNFLMAGMVVTMGSLMPHVPNSGNPLAGEFWFIMSMSLMTGFALAYPMNWWLVGRGLKHGMITVRPEDEQIQRADAVTAHGQSHAVGDSGHSAHTSQAAPSAAVTAAMTVLSIAALATGIALKSLLAG